MTIIVADKQLLEAYIQECLDLRTAIKETVDLIADKEAELVSEGFKKPNIKSLVAAIKKSNKQLSEVFFKNTNGTISISPTQTNETLDSNIRAKLSPLMSKDISSSAAEPIKAKLLSDKIKLSKNYGIDSVSFKMMVDRNSFDEDLFLKDSILNMIFSKGFSFKIQ
jgi:hypothetical protein